MTASMILVHDDHALEGAVAGPQKEPQNFNRQPRPRCWLVPLRLSESGMNLEDGEETRESGFSLRLSEQVVSMRRLTMIPNTRASATSLKP